MLEIKSNNGTVDILKMDGTEKRIVSDIGALSRQLVDYIEVTVKRVDEIGRE